MPVDASARPKKGVPQTFDFRRPSRLRREHQRVLRMVADAFARGMATVLSSTLRAPCTVTLASLDQVGYDEWVRITPTPSFLVVLGLQPLAGASVVNLPMEMAMGAIDRLLGGSGAGPHPNRPLTDIEVRLLREMVGRLLPELATAFAPLGKVEPRITRHEFDPQFVKAAAPSDMVVLASFQVRLGDQTDELTLTFPLSSLQRELEAFAEGTAIGGPALGNPDLVELTSTMMDAPVDVTVRFQPVLLTSEEIVSLRVGDVVPLGHALRSPLTLAAGGVPCFQVTAGRRNLRLACQVVDAR